MISQLHVLDFAIPWGIFSANLNCFIYSTFWCNCAGLKLLESSKTDPLPLEKFLFGLKRKWIEKILFYSNVEPEREPIDPADISPKMAPALRGPKVYNTEVKKQSVYINQNTGSELGKPCG